MLGYLYGFMGDLVGVVFHDAQHVFVFELTSAEVGRMSLYQREQSHFGRI